MLTDPEEDYRRGWVPFLGVEVCLDSRPLIPRPETEYWTELAIAEMVNTRVLTKLSVLDMFAGSGAIGLAVLRHVPDSHVTFAEKELRHFPTIKKSLWEAAIDLRRALLVQSNVWESVPGVFDFILANPPYISKTRNTINESVIVHEPPEALFADEDGFALISQFIRGLPEHLAPQGVAWVEHEPFHKGEIAALAEELNLSSTTQSDQYKIPRYTRFMHKNMA